MSESSNAIISQEVDSFALWFEDMEMGSHIQNGSEALDGLNNPQSHALHNVPSSSSDLEYQQSVLTPTMTSSQLCPTSTVSYTIPNPATTGNYAMLPSQTSYSTIASGREHQFYTTISDRNTQEDQTRNFGDPELQVLLDTLQTSNLEQQIEYPGLTGYPRLGEGLESADQFAGLHHQSVQPVNVLTPTKAPIPPKPKRQRKPKAVQNNSLGDTSLISGPNAVSLPTVEVAIPPKPKRQRKPKAVHKLPSGDMSLVVPGSSVEIPLENVQSVVKPKAPRIRKSQPKKNLTGEEAGPVPSSALAHQTMRPLATTTTLYANQLHSVTGKNNMPAQILVPSQMDGSAIAPKPKRKYTPRKRKEVAPADPGNPDAAAIGKPKTPRKPRIRNQTSIKQVNQASFDAEAHHILNRDSAATSQLTLHYSQSQPSLENYYQQSMPVRFATDPSFGIDMTMPRPSSRESQLVVNSIKSFPPNPSYQSDLLRICEQKPATSGGQRSLFAESVSNKFEELHDRLTHLPGASELQRVLELGGQQLAPGSPGLFTARNHFQSGSTTNNILLGYPDNAGSADANKAINPIPSTVICSKTDLTPHELDCLLKYRDSKHYSSAPAFASTSQGREKNLEISLDEAEHLMQIRKRINKLPEPRKKKREKPPKDKPHLTMYPTAVPRTCQTSSPRSQSGTVSQTHRHISTSSVQSPGTYSLPHAIHSLYASQSGPSTYEQTINLNRAPLQSALQMPSTSSVRSPQCQYPSALATGGLRFSNAGGQLSSGILSSSSPSPSVRMLHNYQLSKQRSHEIGQISFNDLSPASVDTIISKVSCNTNISSSSPCFPMVTLNEGAIHSLLLPNDNNNKEKKPRSAKKKSSAPNQRSMSSTSLDSSMAALAVTDVSEATIKLTKKGLPRKPRTPKPKPPKSDDANKNATTTQRTKDPKANRKQSVDLLKWGIPRDLTLIGGGWGSEIGEIIVPQTPRAQQFDEKRVSEIIASIAAQSLQQQSPGSHKDKPRTATAAGTINRNDMLTSQLPQYQRSQYLPFTAENLSQFYNMRITDQVDVSSGYPATSEASDFSNVHLREGINTSKYLISGDQLSLTGTTSPNSKSLPIKCYPGQSTSHLRNTSPGQAEAGLLQRKLSECKPKRKNQSANQSPRKFLEGDPDYKTVRASTPGSVSSDAFSSIFPTQKLLKGTKIPKLKVPKNRNQNFISGQVQSSYSKTSANSVSGTKHYGHTPIITGIWPTLKSNSNAEKSRISIAKMKENASRSRQGRIIKESILTPLVRERSSMSSEFFDGLKHESMQLLKYINLKPNCGTTAVSSGTFNLSSQDEQELRRGFQRLWSYSTEEREFLYSEGKYLVKRDDINKGREHVDVWRIEPGFQRLKKYCPQIDVSRVFHIGQEIFEPIEKDVSLFRKYQPIYVSICIETTELQVIQYFQADRYLQHLMFMYTNEHLYEDYFNILQVLVCQAMDSAIIKESILTEPGDLEWRASWHKTDDLLKLLSDRIRCHERWNHETLARISEWPKMVMSTRKLDRSRGCDACRNVVRTPAKRVEFVGIPYDRQQFFALPKPPIPPNSELQLCHTCAINLRHWSKIVNAKHDILGTVRHRIVDILKQGGDTRRKFDQLNIRDFLMDDHIWVRRMFYDFLVVISEGVKLIEKLDRETCRNPMKISKAASASMNLTKD